MLTCVWQGKDLGEAEPQFSVAFLITIVEKETKNTPFKHFSGSLPGFSESPSGIV
jgi:hypothetical protein